ncbi:isochorismatase family protein [Beijerinckia sp. L45]|uniref:isochorismatase family protein n=1 Tax=Beijerinckia sp. L45 TaxID=1641855 RepID=UPI001FED2D26|nr:isochorismatase family protein [Beijerinckia sp. L45]
MTTKDAPSLQDRFAGPPVVSDADVYARQGFGRSTGVGARPAIIVVDFTNSFVDPAQFGGGNIQAAVTATARLLAAARHAGWPIAYTRVVYASDGSDAGPFARKVPGLLTQTEDSQATQIVLDLAPRANDLIVRKQAPSAFFGTGVLPWLVGHRVDTVIVTGATTSGCVRATVVDAVSHGFATVVPSDCVGDRAIGPHEANLFDMAQKYADVVDSAALIARIT